MFVIKNKIHNCVIIGSGPSGYSAAIYSARSDLNPVICLGPLPGGQLTNTTNIDNYLGFPKGIDGNIFMENCRKQIERFNIHVLTYSVNRIDFSNKIGGIHRIFFEDEKLHLDSRGIIIATGSTPNCLGIDKEKKFIGFGISFCATCDGFFYKGKNVAVVGGGDTALEEASYLSKICKTVLILVRKNYFKASKILQYRIKKRKNIKVIFDSVIKKILGENSLEGIKILDKKEKKDYVISINGLFIAIGHNPNTKILKNQIKLDKKGYIVVSKKRTNTSKPGVFAAGDVMDPYYRQAITSAGTGCMAALDLDKYLSSLNN
ncbi:thioredoxin-disulfide reductase [Blattabacterium cuenoti]|uniref:thioredoxin-disulfide reductase n=1 Tax=Blattabacterium cuenoti TaxID=1653831 RepID=UPI00163BFBB7|nr:thioredoxin-disulfide reductase [Blattabacterium cuenoti]